MSTDQKSNKEEREESRKFEISKALQDFRTVYGDENLVFKRIFDVMRLKAHDMCVCNSPASKYYERRGRFKFRCRVCRRIVSPLVYTPLKGIKVPLTIVLEIIYLTFLGKHGLTAAEIARYHSVNYNTALLLKHRVQLWMGLSISAFKLTGIIQADETYVKIPTGLGPGIRLSPGLGSQRQKPIVTLAEDGGLGRAKPIVVDNVDKPTMEAIFDKHVPKDATVFTDGNPVYRFLSDRGNLHFECNHKQKIYSKNGVNVNTCESLHSLLKSKIYHVHRGVTEEYLQQYADEITWVFSHRSHNPYDAINSLFDVLPPLNQIVTIEPNPKFRQPAA